MKTTPILVSGPMVRAIMDGRKTQTRLVVNADLDNNPPFTIRTKGYVWSSMMTQQWTRGGMALKCPLGIVGDRLAVKETWCLAPRERWEQWPETKAFPERVWDRTMDRPHTQSIWNSVHNVIYKADGDYKSSDGESCWTSPVTMPKWASRITLEIVSVEVERLQDITAKDAIAEGCCPSGGNEWDKPEIYRKAAEIVGGPYPRGVFAMLWDQINGKKHPWESNPWVWVVEFKRVEGGAA